MSNTLSGINLAFNSENCTCSDESSTVTTFVTITMTDRSVATTTSLQQDEDGELQEDTSTTVVLEVTTTVAASPQTSVVLLPTTRPDINAPDAGSTLISTTAPVESSSPISSSVPDPISESSSTSLSSEPSPSIDPIDDSPSDAPVSSAPNLTSEPETSSNIPSVPTQTTDSVLSSAPVSPSSPAAPSTSTSASLYVPPTSPDETPVFAIGSDTTVDIPQTTEIVTSTQKETPPEESTSLISQAPPAASPAVSETDQDATTEIPETTSVPSDDIGSSSVIISVPQTTSAGTSVTSTSSPSKTTSDAVSTIRSDNRKPTDVTVEPSFATSVIPAAPPATSLPDDTPAGDQAGSAGSDGDANINVVNQGSNNTPPTPVLVGSVVGALTGVAMIAFLFWFCWRRRRGKNRRSSFLTPLSFPGSGDEEKSGRKPHTKTPQITHMTESTPFSAGNHGSRGAVRPSRAHGNHQPQLSTVLSMDDSQFDPDNQPVRVSGGSNPFLDRNPDLGPSDPAIPPKSPRRNPFADTNYIDPEPPRPAHQPPAAFMASAPISKRESVPNRPRTRPPSINTNANFRSEYQTPYQQDRSFDAHRNNIRSDQFDLEADNQHVSGSSSYMYPMPLSVTMGPTHSPPKPHSRRGSWGASSSIYSSGVSDTVSEWDGRNSQVPPLPRESGAMGYGKPPFMVKGRQQGSPGVGKAW